jgi:hypothetical protein
MKPRKPKSYEPSLRDKLSGNVMRALEDDFARNGVAALEQMRQSSPERYCELAAKLIAQAEPPDPNDLSRARTSADVARIQLQGVGLQDPSDAQIERAMALISQFMTRLEMIAADQLALDVSLVEQELRQ